jgi:hypothetical protein
MKPEEITQEQRMRIFMLYCNARRIDENGRERISFAEVLEKRDVLFHGSIYDCQLLLKPLDQLTEEHKRELAEVFGWQYAEFDQGRLWLSDKPDKDYPISTFHMLDELPYPAADFLRKHNYAIDYEGIDLFEDGVAVKSGYDS